MSVPTVRATVSTVARRRRLLAVLGVVLLTITASACMPAEERTFFDRTNGLRSSRGVPGLADHDALNAKAEGWAQQMAATGVLAHSQIQQGLEGLPWRALGENVGVSVPTSDTLRGVHDAFVASQEHRRNLLDPTYTHMGVGVAVGPDGRVWVAEVFAAL
jgi:uncharacterized protein YkwD